MVIATKDVDHLNAEYSKIMAILDEEARTQKATSSKKRGMLQFLAEGRRQEVKMAQQRITNFYLEELVVQTIMKAENLSQVEDIMRTAKVQQESLGKKTIRLLVEQLECADTQKNILI